LAQVKNIEWRLVINEPPGVEALKFYQKLRWQKWMRCRNDHPDREFDLTPQMFKRNLAICPHCRAKYNLTELEKQKEIYTGVVRLFGTYQEDTQAFVRGEVAMLINYGFRQLISLIDGYGLSPEQIGMASFPPKDKNTPRANFIAGHYYAINGSIKDKKRRDAAWEYIKFMTGEVARRIRVKTYVEAGWAKFVRPEELKKFGYEDYYREIPPDWIAASTEIEQSAKIEPYNPGFQNVMTTEMGVPIDKILTYENTNPQEVLDECCRRVNTLIMGKEPPARRRKKIMVGRMIFALLLAGLAFLILKFASLLKGKVGEEKPTGPLAIFSTSKLRRHLVAWLFLLAAFLSILVWQYIPLVRGTIIAFLDYRILGGSKFVGLHNFIEVFFQPLFYQVLLNTTLYVGLTVLLGFIAPIVLALFLSEIPYGKVFFRVVFYLPTMVTSLIVIFLWKNLVYAPEGLLNQLLNFFRLPSQQWIRDPNWAMFCIVLARIWGVTGAGSLIYLAALKNVPEEMYEAAEIDGAGIIYKIFHITLPFLRPLIIINFVGVVVTAFQAMQNIFIMTGGGPINATRVIGIDIWYNAFLFLKFGYATAEAWILGSFLIMFTFYQLKILKKVEFKTAQ
jgi:multiple sugar transport system permease protein